MPEQTPLQPEAMPEAPTPVADQQPAQSEPQSPPAKKPPTKKKKKDSFLSGFTQLLPGGKKGGTPSKSGVSTQKYLKIKGFAQYSRRFYQKTRRR